MPSYDAFLEIDGIKGESSDSKHKDTIEIMSFSWGVSASAVRRTGGGAGKASFQDFHFVKQLDKASPQLFQSCATGKHIPKVSLYLVDRGEVSREYMKVTLSDCVITSFENGGAAAEQPPPSNDNNTDFSNRVEPPRPVDQFSLNYGKVIFTYVPQNNDGASESPVTAGWDLSKNVKL